MALHTAHRDEVTEALHGLAAMAADQAEADRWRTIAELVWHDPVAARAALRAWEGEISARSDPDTCAAFERICRDDR